MAWSDAGLAPCSALGVPRRARPRLSQRSSCSRYYIILEPCGEGSRSQYSLAQAPVPHASRAPFRLADAISASTRLGPGLLPWQFFARLYKSPQTAQRACLEPPALARSPPRLGLCPPCPPPSDSITAAGGSDCKDCGGASICRHNRQRNGCKDCGAPPSVSTVE